MTLNIFHKMCGLKALFHCGARCARPRGTRLLRGFVFCLLSVDHVHSVTNVHGVDNVELR